MRLGREDDWCVWVINDVDILTLTHTLLRLMWFVSPQIRLLQLYPGNDEFPADCQSDNNELS